MAKRKKPPSRKSKSAQDRTQQRSEAERKRRGTAQHFSKAEIGCLPTRKEVFLPLGLRSLTQKIQATVRRI